MVSPYTGYANRQLTPLYKGFAHWYGHYQFSTSYGGQQYNSGGDLVFDLFEDGEPSLDVFDDGADTLELYLAKAQQYLSSQAHRQRKGKTPSP